MTEGAPHLDLTRAAGRQIAPLSRSATRSFDPVRRQPRGVEGATRRGRRPGSPRSRAPRSRRTRAASAQPVRSVTTVGDGRAHRGFAPHMIVAQRREVEVLEVRVAPPTPARSVRPPSPASSARPRWRGGRHRGRSAGAGARSRRPTPREQVQQPEDVRGRRGDLEPVVGAEAERPDPVGGGGPMERCVCRTAFGRPVVPELNTSTASSVSTVAAVGAPVPDGPLSIVAVSSRSSTRVDGPTARRAGRSPRPSATACTGAVRSTACPTSTAFHAGLSRTDARAGLADAVDGGDELGAVSSPSRHPVARGRPRDRRGAGRRRRSARRAGGTTTTCSSARTQRHGHRTGPRRP